MRIETQRDCPYCGVNVVIHTFGRTPAKCLSRTLPAWRQCRCGNHEISTSTLASLAPDWRGHLELDPEEAE
jgi:hypothetical protein